MCTISWLIENNDYHIFFNRDEQRTRSLAIPPALIKVNNTTTLMPIDPDGNGTWISTNEFGLSLCLLNYYQGKQNTPVLISRGLLVKLLSAYKNVDELYQQLLTTTLSNYAPFSLLAFGYDKHGKVEQQTWQWNGQLLTKIKINSPYTSSSFDYERVSSYRFSLAKSMQLCTIDELAYFHKTHHPDQGKGHLSVCMHRIDAKSVSISHIHVSQRQSFFHYKNASPCSNLAFTSKVITRQLQTHTTSPCHKNYYT